MKKLSPDRITLGVCYYPEHWEPSLWREDLKRMKEAGIETVRIAEFAWNKFEPHEGEFTFEFFDSFMELTLEEGMNVIFCTPTATPPAWMSEKYPEILNADARGNLYAHGLRRHYNLTSEKFLFFSERISEKIAEHYSKYPNIVAWQLDNEINCDCKEYHSKSDDIAFRRFLQNKFQTIDALNEAIGAVFWNQTYTSWDAVHLPGNTIFSGHANPHMMLLQKRFISDVVYNFFKLQADAIRKYSSAYITTNGLFANIDYRRLVDDVFDFITYDNYPNFSYTVKSHPSDMQDRGSSLNLMRTRSISSSFGIMEQQSGPGGWNFRLDQQRTPKPGQIRLWSLQAIAHGADFVSYFRWRTCTFGTEIYWHGILDYSNRPNRRLAEISNLHSELGKLADVCGKEYLAEAAYLCDYDNEWDGAEDIWHSAVENTSFHGWFRAFQKAHIPYNFVYINDKTELDELKKYKLVVYPHPTILTEKRAKLLRDYAEQGGTVILGCRTGYKDLNGKCYMMPMPCHAAELCGAEVEEFTFLTPCDEPQFIELDGKRVSAPIFNDILDITDGEPIAYFSSDYYKGKCAASLKKIGNGKVYYFGSAFAEDTAKAIISLVGIKTPLELSNLIDIPESIELAIRGDFIFLLNYNANPITFDCKEAFVNVISGEELQGSITIDGYGAVVLTRK